MIEERPNLESSSHSQRIMVDGYLFAIEIFRLEGDTTWTLEVVDHEGTSFIWREEFPSDVDALGAAVKALDEEGAIAFMRGDTVIPFRTT